MQSTGCRLCRIAREARGESNDGLAAEIHGHINSAGCEGVANFATTPSGGNCMTAKPRSQLKFVTLDKESNMSTLWQPEEFLRICTKEELAQKAQDMEVTIPVKKSQETRYNIDPEFFVVNCFWSRRPDGVAINEPLQIVYLFEFKRSTDRDEGFLEVKEAEANEQHKIIIGSCSEVVRNLSRITLWWVTADRLLRAICTPSSKKA